MAGGIAQFYAELLYNLGHAHNPKYPTNLTRADLPNVDLDSTEFALMVKSYQETLFPTLVETTLAAYGPKAEAVVDGKFGPATADLLATPRCGFPDYPVPDGAMGLGEGPLEANWPTACRTKLRCGRNFKSLPGLTEANTNLVWWGNCNNWYTALNNFDIQPAAVGDQAGSHIYCDLGALAGSTLAWSYLAQNSCSAKLAQRFNSRTNWQNMIFAVTVLTHEIGHALGFDHNNDGNALMYPVINDASQKRGGFPNATDLATAKRNGYELSGATSLERSKLFTPRPWGTTPPTEPTDPAPTGSVSLKGTLQIVDDKGNVIASYFPAKQVSG